MAGSEDANEIARTIRQATSRETCEERREEDGEGEVLAAVLVHLPPRCSLRGIWCSHRQ